MAHFFETEQIVILKLALSFVIGLIIGFEREVKHKPVGLKTCTVISVMSCILTIVSINAANDFSQQTANIVQRTDAMRLAAQIISGIGFVGAGVILKRNDDAISGLTTAAIIWAAAGFGITVGAGYFAEAILGTILITLSIVIIPVIVNILGIYRVNEREIMLSITVQSLADLKIVESQLAQLFIVLKDKKIMQNKTEYTYSAMGVLDVSTHLFDAVALYETIHAIEPVTSVVIGEHG